MLSCFYTTGFFSIEAPTMILAIFDDCPLCQAQIPQSVEQDVAGLNLWLSQYTFRGSVVVIATGLQQNLTAVQCFSDGYVVKQPVAWKEYCVEYYT